MSSPNYTPQTTRPDLSNLLDAFRDNLLLNLNCHAIARIVSFDAPSTTVTAKIVYCKQYLMVDAGGNYSPQSVQYPILTRVPVIVMGGGTGSLTFPISPGDECVILFNDRDLQNWANGGPDGKPVATKRKHSLSDGLALVGVPNTRAGGYAYDATHALLKNGTGAVGVGQTNKVLITASYNGTSNTPTLLTVLNELIANVKSLVTATAGITTSGGQSLSGPSGVSINAVTTSLNSTMSDLAGLLE